VKPGVHLGDRGSFSDVAATIAQAFDLEPPLVGDSFLEQIKA
jgi:phosphopentomutase